MTKLLSPLVLALATVFLAGCELYFGGGGGDRWTYCAADGYYMCDGDDCEWAGARCPSDPEYTCSDHADCAAGYLELEHARVRWFLSINYDHIPEAVRASGKRTYRSITMEGEEIEFSEGFTDLHTLSYKEIIARKGYGLKDAGPAIQLAHDIRNAATVGLKGDYHPLANVLKK